MPGFLDLKVTLLGAKPKVWRRFLIRPNASFMDLHEAIQEACGWWNYHLFLFRGPEGTSIAGIPDEDDDEEVPDAAKVKVSSFFKPGGDASCIYEYDFGDGWEHKVVLKGIVEMDELFGRRLLDGGRAFPPEDCGGIGGYEECVRVANGFDGETRGGPAEELKEWLGDWDPEAFNLDELKRKFDQ